MRRRARASRAASPPVADDLGGPLALPSSHGLASLRSSDLSPAVESPATTLARLARISSRILLAALVAAGFSVRAAKADGDHWKSLSPEGGTVLALAVDPHFPSRIYAGGLATGVFKSFDGGVSWAFSGIAGAS